MSDKTFCEQPSGDDASYDEMSLEDLIEQVQSGSEEATRHFVERFGPHILRVARRRMRETLRRDFESIDVEQDVWASFFHHRDQWMHFTEPAQLVKFLGTMASNKAVDRFRRQEAQRRRRRESPDDPSVSAAADDSPTPSQRAITSERLEQLDDILKDLDDRGRQILKMRSEGKSFNEIARVLNINPRTARRTMTALARRHSSSN